jgi:hypothetical protein
MLRPTIATRVGSYNGSVQLFIQVPQTWEEQEGPGKGICEWYSESHATLLIICCSNGTYNYF